MRATDVSRECIFELSQFASFLSTSFPIRAPPRSTSTSVRVRAMSPLCANLVRTRVCVYVIYIIYMYTHVRIYKRRRIYIRTYSRGAFSRRKSRREIIMQKMHQADYDLICRARKQSVSLKEGFPVNLRNYRLRLCSVLRHLR